MTNAAIRIREDVEGPRIQEVIDRHRIDMALANVRRVEFKFGEDSTGDPAVHVTMIVDKDLPDTKDNIEHLNAFANVLVREIIDLNNDIWPYVRTSVEA